MAQVHTLVVTSDGNLPMTAVYVHGNEVCQKHHMYNRECMKKCSHSRLQYWTGYFLFWDILLSLQSYVYRRYMLLLPLREETLFYPLLVHHYYTEFHTGGGGPWDTCISPYKLITTL